MELQISAFWWGILSAVSLPLGAILGLVLRPKQKLNSTLMAFGAGALLFALTIEIFGHVPHHAEKEGTSVFLVTALGAVTGSLFFDLLNQLLNKKGAFMRRFSNAKKYVARLKIKRNEKLVDELGSVKVLTRLTPEHMSELIHHARRAFYRAGDMIFRQGDEAFEMYFIIEGKVEIKYHGREGNEKRLAVLGEHDTFGEMGILNDSPRSADAMALTDVRLVKIEEFYLKKILKYSPELKKDLGLLADQRIDEHYIKTEHSYKKEWKRETMEYLDKVTHAVSPEEVIEEGAASVKSSAGAALAIWLGIFIDGIPESLVIGMLAASAGGMSMAFIAGVFLANLPEAMSSSVSMRKSNFGIAKILCMWTSICLMTGIGAFLGASYFPSDPGRSNLFLVLFIEGLAAGAMLTMIAESMLPEAFEQGGAIVGISTLAGFLAALYVKIM
jgi:CRP-like cAMP-binding protein